MGLVFQQYRSILEVNVGQTRTEITNDEGLAMTGQDYSNYGMI
jgi:hypothetical protein